MKRSRLDSGQQGPSYAKRMTRATAGEKEWKWQHYFSQLSEDVLDKIEMDETALFSVTIDKDADVISKTVRSIIPDYARVCDATACVGGNTISFAKVFRNVTSIEMDPGRFEMLKKNVGLTGYANHVTFVNMDFLRFKENMSIYDFIFFDPPWGGEDYQEMASLDMYLSNISIADVVLSLRGKTRYIGLKSPMNFRLAEFENRIQAKRICNQKFTISRNKGTYWVFTLYEFQEEDYGGILHMLSPGINPIILAKFRTSQKTAIQAPSHKESNFISSTIQTHCPGTDTIVDLTSAIGIQEIGFLSYNLFSSYVFLSNKPMELENNIRAFLPSLTTQPQVHFLHSSETVLLKDRITDARRIMAISPQCCIYIDLFNELSVEQLQNLTSPLTINKIPVEVYVQQCIEYCAIIPNCKFAILRFPKALETSLTRALSCFTFSLHSFKQEQPVSSCCLPHETTVMIVHTVYPLYQNNQQLSAIFSTEPHCLLRKQVNSVISTVLADRPEALAAFTKAVSQSPPWKDSVIWEKTRQMYLSSFRIASNQVIPKPTAIKVDRSIVRVYGNKMKYVDMVVPIGCRPQHILCLGGVDAHLAHDLAKMYGCSQPDQVIVFGEGDRRKEELRSDYQFVPYPTKENVSWIEYRERLLMTLHEALQRVTEIDMIVVCCPHAIPFFGSILSSIISKLSSDAVLIINDHSVTNTAEMVLLDIIHDFHRNVTSCHIDSLLNREELMRSNEVDLDDKCTYLSCEDWENRLKQYGLIRYVSEKNKKLWNAEDPTNFLKYIRVDFHHV